jgi:hypothetical protein
MTASNMAWQALEWNSETVVGKKQQARFVVTGNFRHVHAASQRTASTMRKNRRGRCNIAKVGTDRRTAFKPATNAQMYLVAEIYRQRVTD